MRSKGARATAVRVASASAAGHKLGGASADRTGIKGKAHLVCRGVSIVEHGVVRPVC